MMKMRKSDLRKKYLAHKDAMDLEGVEVLSDQIFRNFKNNFPVAAGDKVHIFISIAKFREVDTAVFIDYLRTVHARVFVPKIVNGQMISIELTENTVLKESSWGISEPAENIDSVITEYRYVVTPLLYCDRFGNRIGYGKGYYDRFFRNISENSLRIGVSFFPPSEDIGDVQESDVPLHHLILPERILSFSGRL